MLDDYIKSQPIAYKMLTNAILKNKYSHAYLIEVNNYNDYYNFTLAFAKALLCPNNFTNNKKCNGCNQCKTIDDENFVELKIVNPDGMWIKKNQIDELQELFSKKAIVGNKKIYVVNGVECLNTSSANSILKFLEEPEEGIIAILISKNIHQVLNTIKSRCQIISLKSSNKLIEKYDNNIEKFTEFIKMMTIDDFDDDVSDKVSLYVSSVVNFALYFEQNKLETIIYENKLWNDIFNNKKSILIGLELLILFYRDVLNYFLGFDIDFFSDYRNEIIKISKLNNVNRIFRKIQLIIEEKEKLKYNINSNLLLDKLIISMEECDNND
jgi:DNA polymerase-3 subunit delta'